MIRPFLVGQSIYLRKFERDDLTGEYLSWLNDHEVTRYMQTGRYPVSRDDLEKWLERFQGSRTDLLFAIVDKATDRHIGNVTLNHIDPIHRKAGTGLMIGDKDYWGRGLAAEAWNLVCDYAFRRLGLHKIVAAVAADHERSVGVLRKLGFQIEGRLRKDVLVDGEFRDNLYLGLLAEDFQPRSFDGERNESGTVEFEGGVK